MANKAKQAETTEQVAYKLPRRLIRLVRREAADLGTYPARVVAERLSDSYRAKPPRDQPAA